MKVITFQIIGPDKTIPVTTADLKSYAVRIGLESLAPGRWGWIFALMLMTYELTGELDPKSVLDEISDLETGVRTADTKPASEFNRSPLQGLWHKHFFSPQFIPHNLRVHLQGNRLNEIINEVLDPIEVPVITRERLDLLVEKLVEGSYAERADRGKLTGEWIIYAKHEGKNYYLLLGKHTDDEHWLRDWIIWTKNSQFPHLPIC